jgi:hypothetical protein
MTVSADESLRRFLPHVLPKGLVRIRHFGLFANRRRETTLARCRELLSADRGRTLCVTDDLGWQFNFTGNQLYSLFAELDK